MGGIVGGKDSGGQAANSDRGDERRTSLLECRVLSNASRDSCSGTGWRESVIGSV